VSKATDFDWGANKDIEDRLHVLRFKVNPTVPYNQCLVDLKSRWPGRCNGLTTHSLRSKAGRMARKEKIAKALSRAHVQKGIDLFSGTTTQKIEEENRPTIIGLQLLSELVRIDETPPVKLQPESSIQLVKKATRKIPREYWTAEAEAFVKEKMNLGWSALRIAKALKRAGLRKAVSVAAVSKRMSIIAKRIAPKVAPPSQYPDRFDLHFPDGTLVRCRIENWTREVSSPVVGTGEA
jgi:hypothetical protein